MYFAFLSCIPEHRYLPGVAKLLGYPAKEIYAVECGDIQVFVEKRGDIFNYMLLDASLDLPDPLSFVPSEDILPKPGSAIKEHVVASSFTSTPNADNTNSPSRQYKSPCTPSSPQPPLQSSLLNSNGPVHVRREMYRKDSPSALSMRAETKAASIVSRMINAAKMTSGNGSSTSRPHSTVLNSHNGSKGNDKNNGNDDGNANDNELSRALGEGKKTFFNAVNSVGKSLDEGKSLEDIAKEGMKVAQKLQKATTMLGEDVKKRVESLTKGPPIKNGWKKKASKDVFRVGSVTVNNVRVFTRNLLAKGAEKRESMASPLMAEGEGGSDESATSSARCKTRNTQGWHKPILFKEIVFSGADLSSDPREKDPKTGLPRVGLKVKEIQRIAEARMKLEAAKNNTNLLFQLGSEEIFSYLEDKSRNTENGRQSSL